MKRFDCLSIDCPLLGPHLLEASAGTGKTFTIEHVFVRLLLEGLSLEEILVVTFTKAATRDLKQRIQSHLAYSLLCLKGEKPVQNFAYLASKIGSEEAIFVLKNALQGFDRSQIFTIHSFCFRVLKEFGFEAGQLFGVQDPQDLSFFTKKRREAFGRFLEEGIAPDLLSPEQISPLLGKYSTFKELQEALFQSKKTSPLSFAAWHEAFIEVLESWKMRIDSSLLQEDFERVRGNYKAFGENLEIQIEWVAKSFENPKDPVFFRKLLQYGGSLFKFLNPSNRKLRAKPEKDLHYPGFFDWMAESVGAIIEEAASPKNILSVLGTAWLQWEEKWILKSGILNPDEILKQMRSSLEIPFFLEKLKSRFLAVIIDEFQDTDPIQWEIFRKAFLETPKLKALYLVGDPKQSIYRFREADVYTYFAAKEFLGESHLYHLDTNFRSSKELISSLNAIFSRNFLPLPKTSGNIAYLPVQAGSSVSSDLKDDKKAVHWMIGDGNASFEETFLPFAIQEILELPKDLSIAIIVKDRFEAEKALEKMRRFQIPCIARSHRLLSETFAFQSIRELLEAVISPEDENLRLIVENGPFHHLEMSFFYWKSVLEERGLSFFFSEFLRHQDIAFQNELFQVLEELFAWELREGFSLEGLKRFLGSFETLLPEEVSRLRMESSESAVQILTLHVSKGLEFDIVFALGLTSFSSRTDDEDEEELNAEKLRQLYVAMTRAKKRLYVPIKKESKGSSPMDLFGKLLEKEEGSLLLFFEKLSKIFSLSFTEIATPFVFASPPPIQVPKEEGKASPCKFQLDFQASYTQSFTSLSRKKGFKERQSLPEEIASKTFPGGKETGTILHGIFEAIFNSPQEIWKDETALNMRIEKELKFSPLVSWTSDIQAAIANTLSQVLSDGENNFTLRDLKKSEVFAEMEFAYAAGSDFIKGFIDLVFIRSGKCYIIDWKTNLLKSGSKEDMEKAMEEHDYELQAAIYKQALKRHFEPMSSFDDWFGGAFYLFIRTGSYVYLNPN